MYLIFFNLESLGVLAQSSSSGGMNSTVLDQGFTGIWESKPSKFVIINGVQSTGYSKILRL